jgi:hypothetical protein
MQDHGQDISRMGFCAWGAESFQVLWSLLPSLPLNSSMLVLCRELGVRFLIQ